MSASPHSHNVATDVSPVRLEDGTHYENVNNTSSLTSHPSSMYSISTPHLCLIIKLEYIKECKSLGIVWHMI